jgi:hypothetical protein
LFFFLFLTGCSKKDPDFTGYVVNRTAKQITIVEITEKEPPNVLLHPGSKLEIGTKVEVRFKEKVIPTMFPTTAPAEVKVIKENADVRTMLRHLLSHINEKQGPDSYTSVLSIQNQAESWIVNTKEYDGIEFKPKSYRVRKKELKIEPLESSLPCYNEVSGDKRPILTK